MVDAGWFTDPESPTQLRWWDGHRWTEHRHAAMPAAAAVAPIVVQPTAVAPVWTPPYEIYPAPTPLATSYPPPEAPVPATAAQPTIGPAIADTPAPAASAAPAAAVTSATASFWEMPEPEPRSSRNLLLAVLIPVGTLILVLIVFIAVNITQGGTAAPTTAVPPKTTTTDTDVISQFGTPGAPTGLTPVATIAGTNTTAGAALAAGATTFPETLLSSTECKALSYVAPVTAADKGSSDKMLVLPSYSSADANPDLILGATVRDFPSAAKAKSALTAMTNLLNECQNGYTNAQGKVMVIGESAGFDNTPNESWTQYWPTAGLPPGPEIGRPYYDTVNFFRGSSVVRVTCQFNNFTSANDAICSSWLSEISRRYALLN
jgi:hypothetical protein